MLVLADAYTGTFVKNPQSPKGQTRIPPPSMTNPPKPTANVPIAPSVPPVIVTTMPAPVVTPPVQEVPGAGPVVVATTTPDSGGVMVSTQTAWWNLFDPNAFSWWKPVVVAAGIALFGGAILSALSRKRS